jgi:type I restriction enzyme S subunit
MAGSALAETRSLHVPAAYGEPPDGWTWSRLDDVSEGVFDCPHSTPKLTDAGPFVVRTQDIITGVFRAEQAGRVSEETYAERIARVTPSRGDLLYSREGTYFGIAAEVPAKTRVCLGQRMVLIRPDKRRLNFSFLCHWLNSPIMAAHIHGYRDGTVAERLNLPTIRALPILIPPLAEQKAIAAVLGALDEKIELNRRMNATLEAMARTLFQSWFVDFDPVRAKLDGRKPVGLDEATAALFPEHLEDSPLGHIPKGWKACPLAELIEVVKGRSYRSEELAESKTALVTLKSFLRGGGYRIDGLKPFTGEYKPTQRVRPGDLVVAFTDVTQAADVIGKPALVRSDARFETLVASLDVGIVRPKSKHVSIPFLYCLFLTAEFQAHTYSHATGTTVLHLGARAIPSFISVVPPVDIAKKFVERADPIFRLIDENAKQSRTLATLRDTLLPKLLSGELSVGAAAAFTQAAN